MFVLRRIGTMDFICKARTLKDLKDKINKCYWSAKGCTGKGSVFEMADYMKDKVISDIKWRDLTPSQLSDNSG